MSSLIEISHATLELFIVLFFFKQTLTPRKLSKLAYWSVFLGILLIHILRSFIPMSTYINLSISIIICGALASILFKDFVIKKIAMLAIYVFVLLITDILARFIISGLIGITYSVQTLTSIQRYIGMLITNSVCFVILSYISMIAKRKRNNISTKYWIMMLLFPIFSLFIIISTDIFIMMAGVQNIKYILLLLIIFIGLVYFNIVVFEFIDTYSAKIQLAAAEQLIDKQADNYRLLEINEKELRTLKHNIKNHMSIMQSMIDNNDISSPQQFMNSLNNLSALPTSIVYTNDSALDAILNVECRKASELGIDYLVKTHRISSTLNMDAVDKSIILCNAIDNAIEACEKVDKKFVLIDIASDSDLITICIENSSLPFENKDNSFLTTKKDTINHGFGMNSIQHALNKYDGKLTLSYNDGIAKCIIVLNNPPSNN